MPRNGSGVYNLPPGTPGIPDTPVESEPYNTLIADLEFDLNYPRPIVAGGTGASTPAQALSSLGALPIAGGTMTGLLTLSDDPSEDLHAVTKRYVDGVEGDLSTGKVDRAGDTMTGPLTLPGDPTEALHAVTKQYAAPFDAMAFNGMQINGGLELSQVFGGTPIVNMNAYFADQWMVSFAGSALFSCGTYASATSGTPFEGFPYHLMLSITTGALMGLNDIYVVQQPIEGFRTCRLRWGTVNAQPITISFWSCHHDVGTYTVSISNHDGTRSYCATYTQDVSNAIEYKTIVVPGCTTGVWNVTNFVGMYVSFTCDAGVNRVAAAANAWETGLFLAAPGQVHGAATSAGRLRITGLTVFQGAYAPTAEQTRRIARPADSDLTLAQRYLQHVPVVMDVTAGAVDQVAACPIMFAPQMRAVPTMISTGAGVASNVSAAGAVYGTGIHNNRMSSAYVLSAAPGRVYFYSSAIADARL